MSGVGGWEAVVYRIVIVVGLIVSCSAVAAEGGIAMPAIDTFNYAVGTQTFGASYGFTKEPRLIETAKVILEMGSNTIKFAMGKRKNARPEENSPEVHSLTEQARDNPVYRQLFDMPFACYAMWTHTFFEAGWRNGLSDEERAAVYKECYEFASYLLKTYSGTHKTFFLGHWEGDWLLRPSHKLELDVPDRALAGMIDWLNVRQKAVDDAKRRTPHHDVQVFNYAEVNLVKIGMQGSRCLTTDVLPKTNVDFVSYSCYDTEHNVADLKAALDFIESKLPAKAGIPGKRVFIGEYGFPAFRFTPEQQDTKSRAVMRVGLDWGCPLILYWEMYNNEVDDDGKQRGFWMIDDRNVKQPIYHTHQRLYAWARKYAADFAKRENRPPTFDEYRKAAVQWLDNLPK